MLNYEDIIVLDDAVPKELQDILEGQATHGVKYTFLPNVASSAFEKRDYYDDNDETGCAFTSRIRLEDGSWTGDIINADFFTRAVQAFMYGVRRMSLDIKSVDTVATFLHLPVVNQVKNNLAHIDRLGDHLVGIYYVFDSNEGNTIMFNESVDDLADKLDDPLCNPSWDLLTKFKEIEPKKGRLILFNGKRYHCTTTPTRYPRSIINFNATWSDV